MLRALSSREAIRYRIYGMMYLVSQSDSLNKSGRRSELRRPSGREKRKRSVLLVCRRTVQRRDRNVVQSQIDAELPAMMYQVIQNHSPNHGRARHAEDRLTAL